MSETRETFLTAAETAAHFNVTPRTLRVHEREGLIRPARTDGGWRMYGPREFERLYLILTLKRFGLTLKAIGELLAGGADLERVLTKQESALQDQLAGVKTALASVVRAREHLARQGRLTLDELVQLTRETAMTEWQKKLGDMARENLTSEQEAELAARMPDPAELERVHREWNDIFAIAERLKGTDPGSPEAQEMARRANGLVHAFSQGNKALEDNAGKTWERGFADPDLAAKLPVGPEAWQFLCEARARVSGN